MSATITGPPAPPPHPGDLVVAKRYRVLRTLGRGGMGAVVEVLDLKTDRLRALKLMRADLAVDATLRARFELEAMVAGRVESEHVIEVLDAGIDEATGSPYLVMELLRGDDLGALVKRDGPLSPERALLYLGQIAMGLDRTHADHVVHRDLKPENLFLSHRDDGSPRIKILDFGVAKVIATSGAQSTRSLGTPLYMAPEQLTGDGAIDARADLYALGHVAFALLTGMPYFAVEQARSENLYALALKMARGPSEPATERARASGVALPAAFDAWFAKAVAPAVNDRFESASDLVRALAATFDLPAPAMRSERETGPRPRAPAAADDAMTTPDSPSFLTPTVAAAPLETSPGANPDSPAAPPATSSAGVSIPSSRGPRSASRWLLGGGAFAALAIAVLVVRGGGDAQESSSEDAIRGPGRQPPPTSAAAATTGGAPTAPSPVPSPSSPSRSTSEPKPTTSPSAASRTPPPAPRGATSAAPAKSLATATPAVTAPPTRPTYDPLRDF